MNNVFGLLQDSKEYSQCGKLARKYLSICHNVKKCVVEDDGGGEEALAGE